MFIEDQSEDSALHRGGLCSNFRHGHSGVSQLLPIGDGLSYGGEILSYSGL
jgi:hypothetical protein